MFFKRLPSEQQRIFARDIYFAELREAGREYNNLTSTRFGSYLLGRCAIQSLFPDQDAQQRPMVYNGDILLFGASGVHTNQGGDIQMLTPGGCLPFGVEGPQPPKKPQPRSRRSPQQSAAANSGAGVGFWGRGAKQPSACYGVRYRAACQLR